MKTTNKQSGFTLVEIAIVLVIIGLLLGGILKGQELVQNARVRNVADQQSSIKAAYYAFQDRYRALPGDYKDASKNIPNVTKDPAKPELLGNGKIEADERAFAWWHLTGAGFLSCSECAKGVAAGDAPSASNSPTNAYGGFLYIEFDKTYEGNSSETNNLKSGAQLPSNVLSEVDRKIDDGNPATGAFRASAAQADAKACIDAGSWKEKIPEANCGAANLF
jgi:prepilin-type N-terminal cleavage/methylation domain-containing protein